MKRVDLLINVTDSPYYKWGDREKQQAREFAREVIDTRLPHLSSFADDNEIQCQARKIVQGILIDPKTSATFLMPKAKQPLMTAIQSCLKNKGIGFYQAETKILTKGRQTKYRVFDRFIYNENR